MTEEIDVQYPTGPVLSERERLLEEKVGSRTVLAALLGVAVLIEALVIVRLMT